VSSVAGRFQARIAIITGSDGICAMMKNASAEIARRLIDARTTSVETLLSIRLNAFRRYRP
jgi:hypothetical protein